MTVQEIKMHITELASLLRDGMPESVLQEYMAYWVIMMQSQGVIDRVLDVS